MALPLHGLPEPSRKDISRLQDGGTDSVTDNLGTSSRSALPADGRRLTAQRIMWTAQRIRSEKGKP